MEPEHLPDEGRQPADLELGERATIEGLERELPLPRRVEERRVRIEADERRVLAHDRRGERVVGLDRQLVGIDVLPIRKR